jgi:hypothetical protein
MLTHPNGGSYPEVEADDVPIFRCIKVPPTIIKYHAMNAYGGMEV